MALIPASLANSENTLRRLVIVVLLYCIPAFQAMVPVVDPDIWWHLRTGQWIVDHAQVPATDPFSAYGDGKRWIAYSWLFEILVYALFTKLGLMGILVFTVSMSLLIALVLHGALRRAELPFIVEVFSVAAALGRHESSNFSPILALFDPVFHGGAFYFVSCEANGQDCPVAGASAAIRFMGELAHAVHLRSRCAWTVSRGGSSVAAAVPEPIPEPSPQGHPWTSITSIISVSGCNFDNTLPFSTLYSDF